nr:excinuclease ABC subunit UvrA [bacterium]
SEEIVNQMLVNTSGSRLILLAPLVRGRKGEFVDLLRQVQKDGYVRVRVDGVVYPVDAVPVLRKQVKHDIDVVVDRIKIKPGIRSRLTDSVETALKLGNGLVRIEVDGQEQVYSEQLTCRNCGINYEELTPRLFSFNSPYGACPDCSGLGTKMELDPGMIVPLPELPLVDGAIEPWRLSIDSMTRKLLTDATNHFGISRECSFGELPPEHRQLILYGSGNETFNYDIKRSSGTGSFQGTTTWEGVIPNLERRYRQTKSDGVRRWIEKYMSRGSCPTCAGTRLNPQARAVKVNGMAIQEVTGLTVTAACRFFADLQLTPTETKIAHQVLKEIDSRLSFLEDVGVGYLNLSRSATTLSGGEAQRIRLATQIGSQLVGVLYILDEPSIGLHQRDNNRLLNTLKKLRDLGNTVMVVEHDRDTILAADYVVDLGPGAGEHGGKVVAVGTPRQIIRNRDSITGAFLAGREEIALPERRRQGNGAKLLLKGAGGNNLRAVNTEFPLGKLICVTGVSGSGKSTLVNETLYPLLANRLQKTHRTVLPYSGIEGLEHLDKVIDIDQSPIGRTPRSNPATYTGMFTYIRELFTMLPEAKMRGYKPGRFSFNVKGGRCEACEGDGIRKIEMHFLPDVYVTCEVCHGRRYNRETLEVRYKGKSIADVLEMTVEEALQFFAAIPRVASRLQTLFDVGLGYIHLGQQATTLSGGEAQRVKLSAELARPATGRTIYILDEPTTGLHFADIRQLLDVLDRLVDRGNTVLVIEHNLDVIKTADHIIDLGPEGGDAGGRIIATGTPEKVARSRRSYTGRYLRELLPAER